MKAVSYRAIGEENLELSKFYQLQATQLNPTLGQPVSGPKPEFKPPIVNLDK